MSNKQKSLPNHNEDYDSGLEEDKHTQEVAKKREKKLIQKNNKVDNIFKHLQKEINSTLENQAGKHNKAIQRLVDDKLNLKSTINHKNEIIKEQKKLNKTISKQKASISSNNAEIANLKEEQQSLERNLEDSKSEISKLTDERDAFKAAITLRDSPNQLYNKITGKNVKFDSKYVLEFDLIKAEDRLALKVFSLVPLSTQNRIVIKNGEAEDADVKLFLEQGVPKVTDLKFNIDSKNTLMLSRYTSSLLKAIPKVKKVLGIYDCRVSSSDLNALFPASKHLEYLFIKSSWITLDEPLDFGEDTDYQIKYIFL